MYTFITEMLGFIYKNNISSPLSTSVKGEIWEKKKQKTFEMGHFSNKTY